MHFLNTILPLATLPLLTLAGVTTTTVLTTIYPSLPTTPSASTTSPSSTTTATSPTATPTYLNSTREFHIRTKAKKSRFNNLWLYTYHTGAGTSDAVLDSNLTGNAMKGFLSSSVSTPANTTTNGTNTNTQLLFDVGAEYPWSMSMEESFGYYAAWEPMAINAGGGGTGGFFINGTGIQWSSGPEYDEFGGWLVCDWAHEVPQLFWRVSNWNTPNLYTPASCANVELVPVYI